MAGTMASALLLVVFILAVLFCIFAPMTVMGVMFWNWRKELGELARVRQARTTHIR